MQGGRCAPDLGSPKLLKRLTGLSETCPDIGASYDWVILRSREARIPSFEFVAERTKSATYLPCIGRENVGTHLIGTTRKPGCRVPSATRQKVRDAPTVDRAPLLPPDVLPPQLLVDDQGLRAWLRVCAASLREDRTVRAPQDTLPAAAPTPGGLRGLILHALGRAGAAGLTEGDLLGVSEGVEGALPSALTLLALQGLAEQRGGRWRVCEGAVLRSRA